MSSTVTNTIGLIGAGQIGTRHLQALIKCDFPASIFIVETDETARRVALEKLGQFLKSTSIESIRFGVLDDLPETLDLGIIATNSKERLGALTALLKNHRPRNLILEKVLFTSLKDLGDAEKWLKEYNVKTWVNCAKRAFPGMHRARDLLNLAEPFRIDIKGTNWGLACNSIHFIDLVEYFTGQIPCSIDESGLDTVIHESKRHGYIEFTGTLKVSYSNGTELSLESAQGEKPFFEMLISQKNLKIEISENTQEMKIYRDKSAPETVPYQAYFQSDLTQRVARQILLENRCDLTPFGTSLELHKVFLQAMLRHYSRLRGKEEDHVPIT